MAKTEKQESSKEPSNTSSKPKCGLIMPISQIDGCGAEHWAEILSILKDVSIEAGFEPNLVSDSDESGIIQKRIIQNIYSNEIVICDVSGKNPNVMFELGMRLAFDKATVIIKDDKTDYSFDTGVIEHLGYPRDLRFYKILEFKESLKKKLEMTYKKSIEDANYSTFLKSFGEYKIAHLKDKEVTSENFMLNSLEDIRMELRNLRRFQRHSYTDPRAFVTAEDLEKERIREEVIKKHFAKFIHDNNIKGMSDLSACLDECYEFIENQDEVREVCGNRNTIRRISRKIVGA